MRDGNERLLDMLEAIEEIERYAVRGREAFLQDELVQVWMVHHLQIIGEAAARLTFGPAKRFSRRSLETGDRPSEHSGSRILPRGP